MSNELIEKIARLKRYNSKLLNLGIVKFYKSVLKAKDEVFYQYLTKKNLLTTIVDIFIENPNKTNLLHSSILELFDYLTKEYNKKVAIHLMENFEDKMLKHPTYGKYFRNFVTMYENKEEINLRGIDMKEKVKKEEFMPLSSMDYKVYEDDEDEKYN